MERDIEILKILKGFQEINIYLRKEIYEIAGSFSYTIPQLKIIALLAVKDGLRVSDLSIGSSLSESTVSGIVDRLVKHKAIIRKRSKKDRRVINLFLSKESKTEYEQFTKKKDDFFAAHFKDLSASQINKILEGLSILQERIITNKPIDLAHP